MYTILNWNTGLTENQSNLLEILQCVKKFVDEENTIAVLQQIPYKIKDADGRWVYSNSYNEFVEIFSEEKYEIISNNTFNNGFIFMQTVIVTKVKIQRPKDNIMYLYGNPTNREIAVEIENVFSLLGIHAKNGKDNLPYIKNINGNADIIVGDFNAGDYPQYTYWRNFREILPTHVCICNLPTKRVENSNGELIRETCIDHIFVRRELVTKCENLKVHENIKLSDHYPITFNIKL